MPDAAPPPVTVLAVILIPRDGEKRGAFVEMAEEEFAAREAEKSVRAATDIDKRIAFWRA